MELTLDSAFSTGGMVGHLSYLLLVASMLMRSMLRLRLLVVASALVAIVYDAVWLKDPVGIFWETLLVSVNIWQLLVIWYHTTRGQFTAEERMLAQERLGIPDAASRRRLLNGGIWCDEPPGTQLTAEGETPSHLVYISSGSVSIERDGRQIALCGPGNFVGEMSLFQKASKANATAIVVEPVRCWKISHERIRHLRQSNPELAAAIDSGLARDMRRKIEAGNEARAAADA